MAQDNQMQIAAREWVDSLERKWRLQILSRRFRVDQTTGEQREMPTRIRRFVEGMPIALAPYAIGYLLSKAPYSGIVFNGVELGGEYRPTLTTWQRDDSETVNGGRRTDGTYTLIQDLVEKDLWDSLDAESSASCSQTASTAWVWDAPEVEPLPVTGDLQGVSWSIQGVNRNEDGTFDYALVKRVSLTTDTGWVTQSDGEFETVETRTLDGVYGSPSAGWRSVSSASDTAGTALVLPSAGSSGGVSVSVQAAKTEDCTYRLSITRTTAKAGTQSVGSSHTQYEGSHESQTTGQVLPLGTAPDASNGKIVSHDSQKQQDGTFRNSTKVRMERPVPESSKQVSVGRKGRRTTVVDTNQRSPADMSDVSVGGTVKVEKTPGGLFNNSVTTWDSTDQARVSESCTENVFQHQHSETVSGVSALPQTTDHVSGSGTGGMVKSRQTDMDDDGAITQTTVETQEKLAVDSDETWSVGPTGVSHTVKHRNVSSTDTTHFGTVPTFSVTGIGTSLSRSKTPGGLYDVTMSTPDRTGSAVDVGKECSKTAFIHVDLSTQTDPSGVLSAGHVPEAGGGVYTSVDRKLNSDGSTTITTRTSTEVLENNAEVSHRRTQRALVTQVTNRNVPYPSSIAAPASPGESVSVSMTDGKQANVTTVSVTPLSSPDHEACTRTLFEHHHDAVSLGSTLPTADVAPASGGVYHQRSSDVDEYGVVRTLDKTVTEVNVQSAQAIYASDRFTRTSRVTDRNVASPTVRSDLDVLGDGEHAVKTFTYSKNNGGSTDVTEETTTAVYRHWDQTSDTNWRYSRTVWFTNATQAEKDSLFSTEQTAFTGKITGWRTTGRMPVNYNVSPSVSQNKFGLFDGSFSFSASWDMDSAGQTEEIPTVFHYWEYVERSVSCSPSASATRESATSMVVERKIYCASGRGYGLLLDRISGYTHLFSGSHYTFNPITQVWNLTLVTDYKVRYTGYATDGDWYNGEDV